MDCSKTEVFFDEWKRMCEQTETRCAVLDSDIAVGCNSCAEQVYRNYKKAIQVVQEWSDSHPVHTYLDEFRNRFPKCILDDREIAFEFCVNNLFYGCNCNNAEPCYKHWGQEYKDDAEVIGNIHEQEVQ